MKTPSATEFRNLHSPAERNTHGSGILAGLFSVLVAMCLWGLSLSQAQAQTYTWSTFAGGAARVGGKDGQGHAARFHGILDVATDGGGNVYVLETPSSRAIRKITPEGVVSTILAAKPEYGHDDGAIGRATFGFFSSLAVGASGDVYLADDLTVRKMTPEGMVSTLAGSPNDPRQVDGVGGAARFEQADALAVDATGNVYVADKCTVRKITPAGVVSTLAGVPPSRDGTGIAISDTTATTTQSNEPVDLDGTGSEARFAGIKDITVDKGGNVWVLGGNHSIRRITPNGIVTTLYPKLEGLASPVGLTVDTHGDLYISDVSLQGVLKVTAGGTLVQIAGTPYSRGNEDGAGKAARFNAPTRVALHPDGSLVVADYGNYAVRKVTPQGMVSTLAGPSGGEARLDESGNPPWFGSAAGIVRDGGGNLYVADFSSHVIRRISPTGVMTTLAGGFGMKGSEDGIGAAARFNVPLGLALDSSNNIYVADCGNHLVRKISKNGAVTTVAGRAGVSGAANGIGSGAQFNKPSSVGVDRGGNLYVADLGNNLLRKITPDGAVSTLAGTTGVSGISDGVGSRASFRGPFGVAVDGVGSIYVADGSDIPLRKVTPEAVVNTLVDAPGGTSVALDPYGRPVVSSPDGVQFSGLNGEVVVPPLWRNSGFWGQPAQGVPGVTVDGDFDVYFTTPSSWAGDSPLSANSGVYKVSQDGLVSSVSGADYDYTKQGRAFSLGGEGCALDANGGLYVAGNQVISKVLADGAVFQIAGTAGISGGNDGVGNSARFNNPSGLAIDGSGNIYVADTGNHTIRKITRGGVVTTVAGKSGFAGSSDGVGDGVRFANPSSLAFDRLGNLYVADTGNSTIRRISPEGIVSTFAGHPDTSAATSVSTTTQIASNGTAFNGGTSVNGNGVTNLSEIDGATTAVTNATSTAVKTEPSATYPATNSTNSATTAASSEPTQTPVVRALDGVGSSARFNRPKGLAVDGSGNVYVADTGNCSIRKITPSGVVTTLAGKPRAGAAFFSTYDGVGKNALFTGPQSIATDEFGNLFIAEKPPNSGFPWAFGGGIRKVTPDGVVSTIGGPKAGWGLPTGGEDGIGNESRFSTPSGIAVGRDGRIYVVDSGNNNIRLGTLNAPPTLTQQPVATMAVVGGSAALSVAVSSDQAVTYQWQKNGVNLTNGTLATYSINSALPADAGSYSVIVSTAGGTLISSTVQLTVGPPAAVLILTQPSSQTVNQGSGVTFAATVSGSGPIQYQWRKNGTPIPGVAGSRLTLDTVSSNDIGSYDVVVSNSFSSVASKVALLSVNLTVISGTSVPLTFSEPFPPASDSITTAQLFSVAPGVPSKAVGDALVLSSGTVVFNTRTLASSGSYLVRFTQTGRGGLASSVESPAFRISIRSLSSAAGHYEALLTNNSGDAPDAAVYRGLFSGTVTKTGMVSGRLQYVEAPPLVDEYGSQSGMRTYIPVTRAFVGAMKLGPADPLKAVFSVPLGGKAPNARQELAVEIDFSSDRPTLCAVVRDQVSSPPDVWVSSTPRTIVTVTQLASAASSSGTVNLAALAGRFALFSDSTSTVPHGDVYILSQILPTGRAVWTTRMPGGAGAGSAMINALDPGNPSFSLFLAQASSAALYTANVLMGQINFRHDWDDSWRISAGADVLDGRIERQSSFTKRQRVGGLTVPVYSAEFATENTHGVQALDFMQEEGVRWSGFSNSALAPVGFEKRLQLSLDDPEKPVGDEQSSFSWNVTLSKSGAIRTTPVTGSGSPLLSLRLDAARGEFSGSYFFRGARRRLYGLALPSERDQSQLGRGWIERGVASTLLKEAWLLNLIP